VLRDLANSAWRAFSLALERITLVASDIAGGILWVMMVLITVDVVLRYAFNAPTKWANEFSRYFMVALVFLALSYAVKENAHIKVDILVAKLPRRIHDWLKVVTSILFLAYAAILFYFNWTFFAQSFALKTTSRTVIDVVLWPAQLLMPVGLAIMSLLLLCMIYTQIKSILGGK